MSVFKIVHKNNLVWQNKLNYSEITKNIRKLRTVSKDQIIWYPGHIHKGIEQLNRRLVESDAVIEVHDCRIPFTGRTDLLNSYGQVKPKILVLNKTDLISTNDLQRIIEMSKNVSNYSHGSETEIIFTQLTKSGQQNKLFTQINDIIKSKISQETREKSANYVMVTGIPNVGKSTFINALRNWHSVKYGYAKARSTRPTSVGPNAGVTRSVSHKILISDGPPPLFVLDSPGIWEPSKEDLESVLKMALCGCFNFDSVYKEIVIDYMLYWLNKNGHLNYVRHYDMPGPTDNIVDFLQKVCVARGLTVVTNKQIFGQSHGPNIEQAIAVVYRDFNRGLLGRVVLDKMDDAEELYRNRSSIPIGTVISASPRRTIPFEWHHG